MIFSAPINEGADFVLQTESTIPLKMPLIAKGHFYEVKKVKTTDLIYKRRSMAQQSWHHSQQ